MDPDQLSSTFAALADPTRRAILERLAGGDATVGELAEPFAMSLPAISKHLSVLERAGLVAKDRDGQRRHCRITATPLKSATSWLEEYRRHWEANLDNLDAYLSNLQQQRIQQRPQQQRIEGTARPTSHTATSQEKQS